VIDQRGVANGDWCQLKSACRSICGSYIYSKSAVATQSHSHHMKHTLVQLFLSADMRFGGIGIFLVSTRRTGSLGNGQVSQSPRPRCLKDNGPGSTHHILGRRKLGPPLLINSHICIFGVCLELLGAARVCELALLDIDDEILVLRGSGEGDRLRSRSRRPKCCWGWHSAEWEFKVAGSVSDFCKIGASNGV